MLADISVAKPSASSYSTQELNTERNGSSGATNGTVYHNIMIMPLQVSFYSGQELMVYSRKCLQVVMWWRQRSTKHDLDKTILMDLIFYYLTSPVDILEDTNFHFLRTHLNLGLNGITLPVTPSLLKRPTVVQSLWDYQIFFLLEQKCFSYCCHCFCSFFYIDSFGYIDILRRNSPQQLYTWKLSALACFLFCYFVKSVTCE